MRSVGGEYGRHRYSTQSSCSGDITRTGRTGSKGGSGTVTSTTGSCVVYLCCGGGCHLVRYGHHGRIRLLICGGTIDEIHLDFLFPRAAGCSPSRQSEVCGAVEFGVGHCDEVDGRARRETPQMPREFTVYVLTQYHRVGRVGVLPAETPDTVLGRIRDIGPEGIFPVSLIREEQLAVRGERVGGAQTGHSDEIIEVSIFRIIRPASADRTQQTGGHRLHGTVGYYTRTAQYRDIRIKSL